MILLAYMRTRYSNRTIKYSYALSFKYLHGTVIPDFYASLRMATAM